MIRFLLRLYPSKWRERYGEELTDLVKTTGGLTPRRAADLIGQAVVARARAARRWVTAGGPPGDLWPSRLTPLLALLGLIALVPAVVFASFGLAFTVLGIPVDPYVPLVQTAFETLPMDQALTLLPATGLALATLPLLFRTRTIGGTRPKLNAAWGTSPFACLVAGACTATLLFWAIDRVVV